MAKHILKLSDKFHLTRESKYLKISIIIAR